MTVTVDFHLSFIWQVLASDVRRLADHYSFTRDLLIRQDALATVCRIPAFIKENTNVQINACLIDFCDLFLCCFVLSSRRATTPSPLIGCPSLRGKSDD